jgi:hypothetical protein
MGSGFLAGFSRGFLPLAQQAISDGRQNQKEKRAEDRQLEKERRLEHKAIAEEEKKAQNLYGLLQSAYGTQLDASGLTPEQIATSPALAERTLNERVQSIANYKNAVDMGKQVGTVNPMTFGKTAIGTNTGLPTQTNELINDATTSSRGMLNVLTNSLAQGKPLPEDMRARLLPADQLALAKVNENILKAQQAKTLVEEKARTARQLEEQRQQNRIVLKKTPPASGSGRKGGSTGKQKSSTPKQILTGQGYNPAGSGTTPQATAVASGTGKTTAGTMEKMDEGIQAMERVANLLKGNS